MAEYIDRAQIEYYESCSNCNGDDVGLCENCNEKYIVSRSDIELLPTADVVERSEYEKVLKENEELIETAQNCVDADTQSCEELVELRSKIDKAIEEIEKYKSILANPYNRKGMERALEILKRNIGE